MLHYNKILVALDFCDFSDVLLNRLQFSIKDDTSDIYVLHVIEKHVPQLLGETEEDAMHYTEKWKKKEIESKANAKYTLEKLVSKYYYNNTKCIVESGVPTHCILSVAEESAEITANYQFAMHN